MTMFVAYYSTAFAFITVCIAAKWQTQNKTKEDTYIYDYSTQIKARKVEIENCELMVAANNSDDWDDAELW